MDWVIHVSLLLHFVSLHCASQNATEAFETKKTERTDKFMDTFNSVSSSIDNIYKSLTRSETIKDGGTAHLDLDNRDVS